MKNRRLMFGGGAAVVAATLFAGYGAMGAQSQSGITLASAAVAEDAPLVTLYKNPTCACCADWADHMSANGFRVEIKDGVDLTKVKQELGVPFTLSSCHTAEVGGYALEGHVPADEVRRLLDERPGIAGLAVPGMPAGVPGMPGEGLGSYDIVAFQSDGATHVYGSR